MVETKQNGKSELFRLGWTVLILLAALTVGEYFIGSIAVGWIAPLFLIALIKAGLIVRDYMHISRLFTGDEEGAG
jgi:cytochrome c oxidase subunit IV